MTDQVANEVELVEVESKTDNNITFDVIEDELLAVHKPTVQLYGN